MYSTHIDRFNFLTLSKINHIMKRLWIDFFSNYPLPEAV